MQLTHGNLWNYWRKNNIIVIPTNGKLDKDGKNVMEAGLAKVLATIFPEFPELLGSQINIYGNKVFYWAKYGVFTFPTKEHWRDKSILKLIETSVNELCGLVYDFGIHDRSHTYLPKVGCGLDGLVWEDVETILFAKLNDQFTVILGEN